MLPGEHTEERGQGCALHRCAHAEAIREKYFGVGKVTGTVDKKGNAVSVTGECQVKVPIRQFFTMHDRAGWKIQTRARAQIVNPTKMIRRSRMAERALSGMGK